MRHCFFAEVLGVSVEQVHIFNGYHELEFSDVPASGGFIIPEKVSIIFEQILFLGDDIECMGNGHELLIQIVLGNRAGVIELMHVVDFVSIGEE